MNVDERFSRQTMLPEFGPEGQQRIGASSVLIVGLGGKLFTVNLLTLDTHLIEF